MRPTSAVEDQNNDDKSLIRKTYRYQIELHYADQVGKRDFVGTTAGWGWTAIYGLRELAEKGSLAPLIDAAICAVVGGLFLTFLIKVGFGN